MAAPLISKQNSQLLAYGLAFGGAAIVGMMVIDNFVGEVKDKKARSAFIGPIWEPPKPQNGGHASASEAVKFVAMAVSVYSIIADLPKLVSQWGDVERQIQEVIPTGP